jgi:hypothetical protein
MLLAAIPRRCSSMTFSGLFAGLPLLPTERPLTERPSNACERFGGSAVKSEPSIDRSHAGVAAGEVSFTVTAHFLGSIPDLALL